MYICTCKYTMWASLVANPRHPICLVAAPGSLFYQVEGTWTYAPSRPQQRFSGRS